MAYEKKEGKDFKSDFRVYMGVDKKGGKYFMLGPTADGPVIFVRLDSEKIKELQAGPDWAAKPAKERYVGYANYGEDRPKKDYPNKGSPKKAYPPRSKTPGDDVPY